MRPTFTLLILCLTTLSGFAQESIFKILSSRQDSCSINQFSAPSLFLHLHIQDAYLAFDQEMIAPLELREFKFLEEMSEGKRYEWTAFQYPDQRFRIQWFQSNDLIQTMKMSNGECSLTFTLLVLE